MTEARRPRGWALLVTRNFPPLVGGMERVNQHLLEALSSRFSVALVGPAGAAHFAPRKAKVCESRLRPLAWFLAATAVKAQWLALRLKPRFVIAGSGLTAPIAWAAARVSGGTMVTYLHGLDIIAPSRMYQRFWLPFIRACDIVLVNSRHTAALAEARGIAFERIDVLNPGTNMPVLDPSAAATFRTRHELGNRPLLLSVGRLTRRKGLCEFVDKGFPRIVSRWPEVLLLVIGEEASDALHGGGKSERDRIIATAEKAGVARNIRFLGRCADDELSAAYQATDCHVFPILDLPGDVEGFGMVALESAAHGLPTVAFAVGGVADAIDVPATGRLVHSNDYKAFADAVISVLDEGKADGRELLAFAEGKRWEAFDARLLHLLGVE